MGEKSRAEGLIEQGQVWNAYKQFTVAGSTSVDIHLRTPNLAIARVFLDPQAYVSGQGFLYLYEAPNLSNDGTPIVPVNFRRLGTPQPPYTLAYHTPTVVGVGTQLDLRLIKGAATTATWGGGAYDADREWILKVDTSYMIRFLDVTGTNNVVSLAALFREEEIN
jgi:hypothetical protein